jgi:phosphohistidine phosphatase
MKRLTLFRHAKSGWDDPAARDFDRALNDKGRRAARVMGRHLKAQGLVFDRVAASPAVRCVETLDAMFDGYGRRVPATWDKRIYLASDATLLEVLHDTPAGIDHLLMCGHNPGMEDLTLLLVPDDGDEGRDSVEEKFPTASVASIAFDTDDWASVKRGQGRLELFVRPRDLDPELGPER